MSKIIVAPIKHQALVFEVATPGKDAQTVDLMENCWNGACTCIDYTTRCIPNIKHQIMTTGTFRPIWYGSLEYKRPDRTRCKHITAALMWLVDNGLPAMYPVALPKSMYVKNHYSRELQEYHEQARALHAG